MSKHHSLTLQFMSSENKRELKEMFDSFDQDHDQRISIAELKTTLKSTGFDEQQFQSLSTNLHTDSDGYLSFDDFAKLMRPTLRTPFRMTSKQQELWETFKVFDRDGDGVINANELQSMMQQLGDRVSMDEAQQLISEADSDHDGVVNFDEFCRMMGVSSPRPSQDGSRASFDLLSPTSPTKHHKRFSFRQFFHRKH
ncbi:EF-hand [Hesseltinella vesiculosa]|uniref:EF-hand n=1 Tax=Hesseltinella vesiculosa TaxID=101127 RepID=A0A1X2GWL2_9FUNG|nr:EF-hand [Hesseltinella vesiculosa]